MVDFRIDVIVDPSGAVAGTRTVERELVRVENRADRLRAGLGQAFAFLGGGALLASSIRTLAGFEQAMSEVAAVSGATAEELAVLQDRVLQLGETTRFTATQTAKALADLTRAGFTTREALAAVGDTLLLAQAGGLGLAQATDIATNTLRGFRLSADQAGRVADVLAAAANLSNSSVEELGQGLSFAAPIAATLGVSLEETAAAMGVLADAGIKATRGGTSLIQIFSGLSNPTKEAQAVFQRLGLSVEDLDVQTRGLVPVLQALRDAGINVADAFTLFGDRGGPAFEVLAAGIPKSKALTEALGKAGGSAQKVAKIMDDNLNGAFLRLRSTFENLIIKIGQEGAGASLRAVVEGLSRGFVFLAANADTVIRFIQNLALFLGPRYLLGAVRAIGVAIAANPFGLLVTAIAAVVAAIPDLQTKLTGLIETIAQLGSTLTAGFNFADLFSGLASAIDSVVALFNGLLAASGAAFDALATQPEVAGQLMKKAFRDTVEATIDFFVAMGQTIGQIVFGIGKDVVTVFQNVGGAVGALSKGNLDAAQAFADNLESALTRGANRVATFTGQFKQNLEKLQQKDLLPQVELTAEATNLGELVAREFQMGVESTKPSAQEALDRLIGRPEELAAAAAERAKALTKDLKPAPVQEAAKKEAAKPSDRANELLQQLDAVKALKEEEAALNEVLKLRPGLTKAIDDAMLSAAIAALETSKTLEAGFTRAFLKLQQEAKDLAAVAENVVNAFADRATDAIVEFTRTGEFNFKKFASAVLDDITRILVRLLVVQAISAALGGGTGAGAVTLATGTLGGGGGRAKGGTVQPDRSYVVGENGPELFQPNTTGTIAPNATSVPAPPPQVNVQVVNVDDPSKVPQTISNGDADEAIINVLARNKDRVSQVIR